MPVHFIGDCEWEVCKDPQWSVDSWGVDHCVITWQGRRDKMQAFENSINPFQVLQGYPAMRLKGWANSGGTANAPCIDLEYIGFRSGQIPPAKPTSGISMQSAQGEGSYNGTQYSGSILYKASRTTWTWFETSKPGDTPKYATVEHQRNPFSQIVSYSITNPDGKPVRNLPLTAFSAAFANLVPVLFVSDYDDETLLPGALFACTATVDYKLNG